VLRKKGYNRRRVVIIGAGDNGDKLLSTLKNNPQFGLVVTAVFDNNGDKDNEVRRGVDVQGPITDVKKYLEVRDIDSVFISLPMSAERRIKDALDALNNYTGDVRFVPDIFGYQLINHSVTEIAGIPVVNLRESPLRGFNRLIKWFEDKIMALSLILILSPVMLLISVAIRITSPGPILFKQRRVGWNGEEFDMLKFRSMVVTDEAERDILTKKNDPRVTKIGKLIRKTSIDELPQLFNVLKGDMSLIGPRPERSWVVRIMMNEIPNYMQKHMVKAGITGWAQVNGWRGNTDLAKRIEHDIYYIENWSLLLDLKIIFLTVLKGLVSKNSY